MDLCFAVNKVAKCSANPGKVHFEGLVHLLIYISYNNTLGLKYDADMYDALVSELLTQDIIKNENHLMAFYDTIWKDCPDTGRSTGSYIIFIKVCHGKLAHLNKI